MLVIVRVEGVGEDGQGVFVCDRGAVQDVPGSDRTNRHDSDCSNRSKRPLNPPFTPAPAPAPAPVPAPSPPGPSRSLSSGVWSSDPDVVCTSCAVWRW